jgi:hypothetical protein
VALELVEAGGQVVAGLVSLGTLGSFDGGVELRALVRQDEEGETSASEHAQVIRFRAHKQGVDTSH